MEDAIAQAATELLGRLAGEAAPEHSSRGWLGQTTEGAVVNLLSLALIRSGLLDPAAVASATGSAATAAVQGEQSRAGGHKVVPCPVRAELSNAVLNLLALDMGPDSDELLVEVGSFRPVPIEPPLEPRQLLRGKRRPSNAARLRRLMGHERPQPQAYTSVAVDSLHLKDDNGLAYHLEPVAGPGPNRFVLQPRLSPSAA
ncbi:MAG TPA: hypothetical protein VGP46_11165, partial [Acidimicrobiales bacterium]|nr:hypothetical protein [Acidimicrobiales bacterium]